MGRLPFGAVPGQKKAQKGQGGYEAERDEESFLHRQGIPIWHGYRPSGCTSVVVH
jgi:hypothetical protein